MVCNILANPLYWYGTRLAGIAKVYQKYRPRSLRFRYDPSCPATTSGSVTIGVIEAGVTMTIETAVSTLLNSGGRNINIFDTGFVDYVPRIRDLCYIDGDITKPIVNPFCFFMYALNSDNAPPGLIRIDWEYEFYQGSGDQALPTAVYTSTTPETILMLQSSSVFLASSKLTFGWGAILGFLKTVGVPILRKIGIVVCKSVLALLGDDQRSNALIEDKKIMIREGTFMTIDPSDVYTSPSNYTRVKDSNGSDFFIPDDARVSVYMSGDQVQVKSTQTPAPSNQKQLFRLEYPNYELTETHVYDKTTQVPQPFTELTDYWASFKLQKTSNAYEYFSVNMYFTKDSKVIGYTTTATMDTGSSISYNEVFYNSASGGSLPSLLYFQGHSYDQTGTKTLHWPNGYDLYTTFCDKLAKSCSDTTAWASFHYLKPSDVFESE